MTYLLFQWLRWDYEYLQRALGPECRVLFSKDYKQRVLRYLSGSIPAVWRSKKNDTIVCWYDAQAQAFHRFLKETCGEKPFAETVKRMVESN